MQVNTMTRDMIIDVIVAGAGIWGCMVASRRMVAGRKVLEKRAGGGRNVRFELITLTPNF